MITEVKQILKSKNVRKIWKNNSGNGKNEQRQKSES